LGYYFVGVFLGIAVSVMFAIAVSVMFALSEVVMQSFDRTKQVLGGSSVINL